MSAALTDLELHTIARGAGRRVQAEIGAGLALTGTSIGLVNRKELLRTHQLNSRRLVAVEYPVLGTGAVAIVDLG